MSHNKIKVAGQEPNSSGEISIALNDLSNVSASSPSVDDVLKYASGSWSTSALSAISSACQYILVGQGETNAYSNSTTDSDISDGSVLNFYDTSPKVQISGASVTNHSTTNWIKSITLPAGDYMILTTFRVVFSASGLLGFRWRTDGNTNLSNIAYIGENFGSVAGSVSSINATFTLSVSDTIQLKAVDTSNIDTLNNQGNTPSEFSSLLIIKLE